MPYACHKPPVRPGERLRLVVDPSRLHLFDAETSETLRGGVVAATASS